MEDVFYKPPVDVEELIITDAIHIVCSHIAYDTVYFILLCFERNKQNNYKVALFSFTERILTDISNFST